MGERSLYLGWCSFYNLGLEGVAWLGPSMEQLLVVDTQQPAGLIHFYPPSRQCHCHCPFQGQDWGDFYLWRPSEVEYPWAPSLIALMSCCKLSFIAHCKLLLLHQTYLLMISDDQFHFWLVEGGYFQTVHWWVAWLHSQWHCSLWQKDLWCILYLKITVSYPLIFFVSLIQPQ